jgi:heme/copper-type cytochrome/quinol oxidase subunit 3
MTDAVPTTVSIAGDEEGAHARSSVVGSRLMLAANTTLHLTFLFAYLYLRANNFGGMWRPNGVGTPAPGISAMVLVVPLVTALVLSAAVAVAGRGQRAQFTRIVGVAMLLGFATVAVRVYQLYHTGWSLDQGGYVDISVIWLAVLVAEYVIGALLIVAMYNGHVRRTVAASVAQVRTLFEYWLYVTVAAFVVFALIQFVT